jgi:hypothetical protein
MDNSTTARPIRTIAQEIQQGVSVPIERHKLITLRNALRAKRDEMRQGKVVNDLWQKGRSAGFAEAIGMINDLLYTPS